MALAWELLARSRGAATRRTSSGVRVFAPLEATACRYVSSRGGRLSPPPLPTAVRASTAASKQHLWRPSGLTHPA